MQTRYIRPPPAGQSTSRREDEVSAVRERGIGPHIEDLESPFAGGRVVSRRGDAVGELDEAREVMLLRDALQVGFDLRAWSVEGGPGRLYGALVSMRPVLGDQMLNVRSIQRSVDTRSD